MSFLGQVIKKPFATGSKSEHQAVMLVTAAGEEYVLRQTGGNAFSDPAIESLVGHQVRFDGKLHGYVLLVDNWDVVSR